METKENIRKKIVSPSIRTDVRRLKFTILTPSSSSQSFSLIMTDIRSAEFHDQTSMRDVEAWLAQLQTRCTDNVRLHAHVASFQTTTQKRDHLRALATSEERADQSDCTTIAAAVKDLPVTGGLALLTSDKGHCACEAVKYEVLAPFMCVQCYRCTQCQRETGAAFALDAIVETSNFRIISSNQPLRTEIVQPSGEIGMMARFPVCYTGLIRDYAETLC